MDHEVRPWTMAFSHGPTFMIYFLRESIYKAFGPLNRCKSKCGPREMTMYQKVNVAIFLIYAQNMQFWIKK